MLGGDTIEPMDYISYSQYKSYTSCPRNWYLSKIAKAEEKQTWYLPIGTAVHNMIEDWIADQQSRGIKPGSYDPWSNPKAEDYLYPLIEKQLLIEPDLSKWLAGGPEDRPEIEELALQKVRECFENAVEYLDELDVWEVEYDASGRLPGLQVPIKGYVDIIGEHKKKGPVIIDWKTGSTKPDNFQLKTYAALLRSDVRNEFFEPDFKGRYVMLAPGSANTRYVDLSDVDPQEVGLKYQAVYEKMEQKLYQANAGFGCRFCFNQDNCMVNKGITPRTQYYDRSSEDGYPF